MVNQQRNEIMWKLTLFLASFHVLLGFLIILTFNGAELFLLSMVFWVWLGVLYSSVLTFFLVIFLPKQRKDWRYWFKVWIIQTLSVHWIVPYVFYFANSPA